MGGFINSFRPTHNSWTKHLLYEWKDPLLERGIYIETGRIRSPFQDIIDSLYLENYIHPVNNVNNLEKALENKNTGN